MLDFFKKLFVKENSSETARERLKLVLLSDHISLAPDVIERLKADLLDVISRYVEIDQSHADVTFEHREREIAMLANVPIIGLRDRGGPGSGEASAYGEARSASAPLRAQPDAFASGAAAPIVEAPVRPSEPVRTAPAADAIPEFVRLDARAVETHVEFGAEAAPGFIAAREAEDARAVEAVAGDACAADAAAGDACAGEAAAGDATAADAAAADATAADVTTEPALFDAAVPVPPAPKRSAAAPAGGRRKRRRKPSAPKKAPAAPPASFGNLANGARPAQA